MQTISPNADRLGVALKAVRQTHDEDSSPTVLGAKCLALVIEHLKDEGLPEEDLAPLVALQVAAQQGKRLGQSQQERRKRRPPSDALLARVSAVIDLLVKAGYDESEAAQAIMRRLLAVGVSPPPHGGDARGWKRLLHWRAHLLHGNASPEAREEYDDFTREMDEVPAADRVRVVFDEQLWDRRKRR